MFWRLNRFSKHHNFLRIILNNILWRVPYNVKYKLGGIWRSTHLPYKLIKEGSTVVQVGCPWDILLAGRSRGIHFTNFVGDLGRVIIIEPDAENLQSLKQIVQKHSISNVTIIEKGAWNKRRAIIS